MEYYVVESKLQYLVWNGVHSNGVEAIYAPRLYLHVLPVDGDPLQWPVSPQGQSTGPRRAPPGVTDWWVVTRNAARALWPAAGAWKSTATPLTDAELGTLLRTGHVSVGSWTMS
jgi:hypothetical protein